MAEIKMYHLKNKVALLVENNAEKLFKGLASNTTDKPQNAFLDVFGKIIITGDQVRISDNNIIMIIEKQFLERLEKHLEKYLKLTKTKLTVMYDHNVYYDLNKNKILITKETLNSNVSEKEFTEFRLKYNIPVQGIDYDQEMLLNIENENECKYASFTKGCYLGQEIIARVKNLGKPAKKLVVKYEDECSEEEQKKMTSKYINSDNGKIFGFVFVKNK